MNRITPEDPATGQRRCANGAVGPSVASISLSRNSPTRASISHRVHQRQRAHSLFGHDPFEFVKLSDANLRHQTEYELRSKLIQLRRLYIPASVSIEKLCDLMSDSLSSFAALFRAVLLLFGEEAPVAKTDVVRVTLEVEIDLAPLTSFRSRNDGKLPSSESANDLSRHTCFRSNKCRSG